MIINVTEKHIAAGERCSRDACPVALAMTEAFQAHGAEGRVECCRLVYYLSDSRTRRNLPSVAIAFIEAFDTEQIVKPFSFGDLMFYVIINVVAIAWLVYDTRRMKI